MMGVSPWLTPYMLWELKTGRRTQAVNLPMKRGSALEPSARRAYEAETGLVMQPAVIVDGAYSASLDGITLEGELLLEIKCPMAGRESETWKSAQGGHVPEHYWWQVQHQLMVSGAEEGHLWVYADREGCLVQVKPQPDCFEPLQKAWDDFWRYVEADESPALGPLDTRVRDDPEWGEAAARYLAAKAALDGAELELLAARELLMGLLGHSREQGFGVQVSQYWKCKSAKPEYRISIRGGDQ